MQFKDIIGQEAIKERLRRSVDENRISHAQLLAGMEGTGGLALALAYSQYVLCNNRHDGDSCGSDKCPACRKVAKLVHPDLHFSFPVYKKVSDKPALSNDFIDEWRAAVLNNPYLNLPDWYAALKTDKQGTIYVDEANEILHQMSLKSYESDYKIQLIWMAEKMNEKCANKLLKIIEEPPEKTLILLIAENDKDLLLTIRSRCQLIHVPAIDDESMRSALQNMPCMDGRNIDNMVHLCSGNYLKALKISEEQDNENLEKFKALMRIAYGRRFMDIFKWVEDMAATGREPQKEFLQYALKQLRENFMNNMKHPELVYMTEPELEFSSRFAPFINEKNIIPLSREIERAYQHISMNGYAKIIFTDLILKITKVIR
ncbi:MAG: DNA polymerase III subunit delta [Bacteroidales bacterium]|jgi:DNA polymerase-3 subunit delta'|nr:DNA polymerase III subunit delta [Bacteroidales bacterium]